MSKQDFCTNSGALTATGAEAVYDTTVAINYSVNGKALTKATVADGAAITSDLDGNAFTGLAVDKGCAFVWCLNAAGTVGVAQGPVANYSTAEGAFDGPDAPAFPAIPDAWVPFAYSIHAHGTTGSGEWTFGTSNWNATGMVDLVVNVLTLPKRPQVETLA